MLGVSSSPFSLPPTLKTSRCCAPSVIFIPSSSKSPKPLPFSNSNLKSFRGFNQRSGVQCSSSSRTPGPGSAENESKVVLDAFFLGKAFAEALNERIGSTVGEILSVVGQWQAEQQKQVEDFQEEVLERAKKAKEKAALAVMEDQGLISTSLAAAPDSAATPVVPSSPGPTTEDPLQEMLKD